MKKIIATIFALATILALTIIPASATYSQYNVPLNPDSNGRMWVDVTNSSGNHILYVMIEMDPSDIPEGAEFDVTYTDRSNNFISGPVLDSLGEMLGLYINDSVQFEVTDSSNKTLIKDATFYVEAADRKNAYAINTVAFTQMPDEERQASTYADVTTKISTVKLKGPDKKDRQYYKVSQDNACFTVISSPDNVEFPVSPGNTNFSGTEFNNNNAKGAYGGAIVGSTFMNLPVWFAASTVFALAVVFYVSYKKKKKK